jgi:group I intron endonuclease
MSGKSSYISRIGIYQIQSVLHPERIYIGSSTNIPSRWYGHRHRLEKGEHHSSKLQEHYNQYGLTDLIFTTIMYCNIDEIVKLEQYYLDMLNPYFNVLTHACNGERPKRRRKDLLACSGPTEEKRWVQGSSFYYSLIC